MLQGVLAPAHVQGVAVGEEGPAALLLDKIHHHLGVVGPEIGQVPRLAEVDLDGGELAVKVDAAQAGLVQKAAEFLQQVVAGMGAQVGKIDSGGRHSSHSFLFSK